jgi:hypothetical protein
MVQEQCHTDHNFIDSQGRDLRCLNNRFASAPGASRDPGMDIHYQSIEKASLTKEFDGLETEHGFFSQLLFNKLNRT